MTAYIEIDGIRLELERWPLASPDAPYLVEKHTWHDVPQSKANITESPAYHGSYQPGEAWRESALVTIEGYGKYARRAAYQAARNKLAALGAGQRTVAIRLVDGEEDTWRLGHIVKVDIRDDLAENQFDWAIDARCPDPRRYGRNNLGGQITITADSQLTNIALNPKLQNNLDGWVAWSRTGGTAHLERQQIGGHQSAAAVADGDTAGLAVGAQRIPLSGAVGVVRVEAQASKSMSAHLTLTWLAGAKILHTHTYDPTQIGAADWTILAVTAPETPPEATHVTVAIDCMDDQMQPGDTIRGTRLLIGQQSSSAYFDGDDPGWAWGGTVGNSFSAKTGGSWELGNMEGTAPSTPTISITPLRDAPTGFTIRFHGSADTLTYRGLVRAGQKLELIPGEHAALLDGRLAPKTAVGKWPIVPPMSAQILSVYANQRGVPFTADCVFHEAWW